MREVFGEWYPTDDDDEHRDFVTTARIALDANVLLDLYRISEDSREKILSQLERDAIRPRLFLPYQAGLEYHRNRLTVADEHADQYRKATSLVNGVMKNGANSTLLRDLGDAVNNVQDREVVERLLDVVNKAFREAAASVGRAIDEERTQNILYSKRIHTEDPIRDRIEKLFADAGQIGQRRTSTERREWEDQARARLAAAMPPGTGVDESKRDGGIGDPLIWMEMMDLARAVGQDVLFVSNDMKADWRQIGADNDDLGPLPDLRREFADETGQRYHHVSSATFLEGLNKYLAADVDDEVIDEVKNARIYLSSEESKERGRSWYLANGETFNTTLTSEAFQKFLNGPDSPASKAFGEFLNGPGNPASKAFGEFLNGPGNPASKAFGKFLLSRESQTDSGERHEGNEDDEAGGDDEPGPG